MATGAYLAQAIVMLAGAMPGIKVSGPTTLPLPEGATLPPTVIIQAAPGASPASFAQRIVVYTCRCYGKDDAGALAAYEALHAALTDAETGEPISNRRVTWQDGATARHFWLYRAEVGVPAGPAPDPESRWPVLVAIATMVWSAKEVS